MKKLITQNLHSNRCQDQSIRHHSLLDTANTKVKNTSNRTELKDFVYSWAAN